MRELESARSEEQRALDDLQESQDRLNDATKEYNDATADTPANILRIAEAKQNLDNAIAKVDALDNFRGALLQIVEDTGIGLNDIYQQLMDIKNFDTSSGGSTSTSKGGGAKKTNKSTSGFDDEFIGKSKKAFEDILDDRTATDKILSDSKFGGASGVTTVVNLKNEFNIEGALNSDEVAIKVIEAQKRGLNVVL
jgi:exonuclease VII small subunit